MEFCQFEKVGTLVIFLHLSVIVFTGGVWHTPPLGRHPLRQTPPLGRPPPPQMATAADGTHPTGMYSCLKIILHDSAPFSCQRDTDLRIF